LLKEFLNIVKRRDITNFSRNYNTIFFEFNPPAADEGLIPRPLGRLNFPLDTPLLAAG
jgi:hypothetical protein